MLISFSVENWQSFKDRATLSMCASREKQHSNRIATASQKSSLKLLPIAAIFGANASGKTKFFNALAFAKRFIININQPDSAISREYFKLDKEHIAKPTSFYFELLINKTVCYEFYFSVNSSKVIEEKLTKILAMSSKIIYERKEGEEIKFHDPEFRGNDRLKFIAEGTRPNQLFLTNAVSQNAKIESFQLIYNWFKDNLILVGPDTELDYREGIFQGKKIGELLSQLDTGIASTDERVTDLDSVNLPESFKKMIKKMMEGAPDGTWTKIDIDGPIVFSKKEGEVFVKKLITFHKASNGEDVAFDFDDESHGTLRLMHLLPIFYSLWQEGSSKVCVVDELDRCLHTLLTRSLLEKYLSRCSQDTESQLIFTTHDMQLIDQNLFRRDEMWVTERDGKGESSLFSFGDYKDIRIDKDVKKSYLQGRLGGVPKISLETFLK